jgi:4-hydroxysphinganine ceramide fatty acyl 2-hydroxylase
LILHYLQKKYLKWVSKTSPLLSYILSFTMLGVCLYFESFYHHSFLLFLTLSFTGWFIWGFIEYIMHRFVFHLESKNKNVLFVKYILHGVHHHEPSKTLFVPLLLRIGVQVVTLVGFKFCFKHHAFLLFFGLELGVIQYITVHYFIHHQKFSSYFPKLTKYHYIHHFVEPDKVFGTSSLFWDKIFGTLPTKEYSSMEYKKDKHFISS